MRQPSVPEAAERGLPGGAQDIPSCPTSVVNLAWFYRAASRARR
jgi:hypothetical protein